MHAIDDTGSDVTFSTSVLVDVIEPSIGDLVNAIHDMQVKEDRLDEENKAQQLEIADQQQKIVDQQKQNANQQKQITSRLEM